MIDSYGNQKKLEKLYLSYKEEMEKLIRYSEEYTFKNQIYWYKDDYYQNEAKLHQFKIYYNKLLKLYDKKYFLLLRNWVNPSSFQ